jgi:hypothetical protein
MCEYLENNGTFQVEGLFISLPVATCSSTPTGKECEFSIDSSMSVLPPTNHHSICFPIPAPLKHISHPSSSASSFRVPDFVTKSLSLLTERAILIKTIRCVVLCGRRLLPAALALLNGANGLGIS